MYQFKSSVKVGEVERFTIEYVPEEVTGLDSLKLVVRNLENITYRAGFLLGPYLLYVDVVNGEYNENTRTFVTADQPQFEPNLLPASQFEMQLSCHHLKDKYTWHVDVVSQVIFNAHSSIAFDVSVTGGRGTLTVNRKNTLDLWNLPVPDADRDHLVVLTHGLHSNVTADMLYLKECIEKYNKHVVVRGYPGNVCKTEKGIQFLGTRVAEFILDQATPNIKKISLIGHSLGGLIQTYAIAYIAHRDPSFFKRVKPVNFVTMASPLLGILVDNPAVVNMALAAGIVGKTGRELSLQEDMLSKLPRAAHRSLKRFKRRTVYGNAVNDGIVPMYTASLLFVDDVVTTDSPMPTDQPPLPLVGSLPKSSVIESSMSVLLPPLPSVSYMMDPGARDMAIIHDKLYLPTDIPALAENATKEEKIAHEWHRDKSWRKVLVTLKPDAHNNIIVRRRFVNAYGWQVVGHMVDNHFTFDPEEDESSEDDESEESFEWLSSEIRETIFDLGPTGMISHFGDMIQNIKDTFNV